MPALTVRQVEDALVRALKRRAAQAGVPAAELHRRILRQARLRPRRSRAELLAALHRLGDLGLEIEHDRHSAPPPAEL